MKLSAAVYGSAAADGGNIAQYWPDWLRAGSVDFLTPNQFDPITWIDLTTWIIGKTGHHLDLEPLAHKFARKGKALERWLGIEPLR